jgi:hypothetical protein
MHGLSSSNKYRTELPLAIDNAQRVSAELHTADAAQKLVEFSH